MDSLSGVLLLMTILSWYRIVEVFETTEKLWEKILLSKEFLPLALSKLLTRYLLMSITESAEKQAICEAKDVKAEKENYLFSKSLLDTIMQDSSIRER